ncbi:hypothetical protein ACFQ36_01600 [Arthrobacter sp. GCM10027362]|uniref:hypothetical protein n=1 Tax=Arthrobacter sp. GCM10027362 TaxID=3273379 RepID=UPI00362547CA
MVGPGDVQLVQVLRAARDTGIDRVWIIPEPMLRRISGPVDLYLLVACDEGLAVPEDALCRFRDTAEQIMPAVRVGVDRIEDLDGMGDPEDLQVLLTMVELTDRLTDREEGLWRVTTASGTVYVLDLTPGRRTLTRLPGRDRPQAGYARIPAADLRRDGETLPLLAIGQLQLGRPGALVIDVRRDGIPTVRGTTPVVSIERLEEA